MPSVALSPIGNGVTFLNAAGQVLNGGKINTYLAGTTTPQVTYTTSAATVANPNPIILNSAGQAPQEIWLVQGVSYKLTIADSASNILQTLDNVQGINDQVSNPVSEWALQGTPTYLSATSFSIGGNQTAVFDVGRRVKSINTGGTAYSTVASNSYNGTLNVTTVTVVNDSTPLDSGLSVVYASILDPAANSIGTPITFGPGAVTFNGPIIGSAGANIANLPGANRFINGDMRIDQRHVGAAQTITAAAALAYTVDRWYGYCTGANVTGQRVAGTAPNQFNYQYTGAASVTKIGHAQRIEAANSQDLAGTTATLSVDLANSLLTTVTWTAWYANSADTFGTLASPTRTQIATGTFTVTSTLLRYSTSISIPAAATTGIEVEFSVGAQISGTFTIGRAKIEAGAAATPFMLSMFGAELALCQRYYEKSFDIATAPAQNAGASGSLTCASVAVSTTQRVATAIFKVTKRAIPTTVTIYNPSAANAQVRNQGAAADCTGTATADVEMGSFSVTCTTPGGGAVGNALSYHWSAEAEL